MGHGEGWERREVKLSPLADYMITYVENPEGSIGKPPRTTSELAKLNTVACNVRQSVIHAYVQVPGPFELLRWGELVCSRKWKASQEVSLESGLGGRTDFGQEEGNWCSNGSEENKTNV